MDKFEKNIMRLALSALEGDIRQAITAPFVKSKIRMISYLLTHALARQGGCKDHATISEELAALEFALAGEQDITAQITSDDEDVALLGMDEMTDYVSSRLGKTVKVIDARKLVGGASKQTIILTLSGAEEFENAIVVRRDLMGGPVELRAADEFPLLKEMYKSGIAVAEPLWSDDAPPFGGGSCIVTRMVSGVAAYDVAETVNKETGVQGAMGLARVLASIHTLPVTELDLPGKPDNATLQDMVETMINGYHQQWERRRVTISPTITAGIDWLRENIPAEGEISLVHGDASLRNLMVHEGRESALLDWELWHFGDHNEDLAYCRSDVEMFIPWEAFLAEYHKYGGRQVNEKAIVFWGMFAGIRNMMFAANLVHTFVTEEHPREATPIYSAIYGGRQLITMMGEQFKDLEK